MRRLFSEGISMSSEEEEASHRPSSVSSLSDSPCSSPPNLHYVGKKEEIVKAGRLTKLLNGCRDVLILYHDRQLYAMDKRCYRKFWAAEQYAVWQTIILRRGMHFLLWYWKKLQSLITHVISHWQTLVVNCSMETSRWVYRNKSTVEKFLTMSDSTWHVFLCRIKLLNSIFCCYVNHKLHVLLLLGV